MLILRRHPSYASPKEVEIKLVNLRVVQLLRTTLSSSFQHTAGNCGGVDTEIFEGCYDVASLAPNDSGKFKLKRFQLFRNVVMLDLRADHWRRRYCSRQRLASPQSSASPAVAPVMDGVVPLHVCRPSEIFGLDLTDGELQLQAPWLICSLKESVGTPPTASSCQRGSPRGLEPQDFSSHQNGSFSAAIFPR